MKLHYYKDKIGNFGDDINEYIWEKFWPEYHSYSKADWLVGVGSIFTSEINQLPGKKLIMGSGYWPLLGTPDLDQCEVVFVRGPLTCKALNLDPALAITDPAVLLSLVVPSPEEKRTGVSFIPHHRTHNAFDCRRIAKLAGLHYIDPTANYQEVLKSIAGSSRVIVEAMHGAIIADAFGIPWQRVSLFNRKNTDKNVVDFKWNDWGASLEIDTKPTFELLLPWPGRNVLRRKIKKPIINHIYYRIIALKIRTATQSESVAYRLSNRKMLANKIKLICNQVKNFT